MRKEQGKSMIGFEQYIGAVIARLFIKGERSIMLGSGENGLWLRVSTQGAPAEYWLSGAVEPVPEEIDTASLELEGWQRVDETQLLCLLGQLFSVRVLQKPEGSSEFYARREELANSLPEVSLVLTLPGTVRKTMSALFNPGALPNFLPVAINHAPPQVGEAALVAKEDGWHLYRVEQLDTEALALWRALGDDLRALAQPADWWLWTPLLERAMEDPEGIERERTELEVAWAAARGKVQRRSLDEQRREIKTAQEQAGKLRALHQRIQQEHMAWGQLWSEAQQKAHLLAKAYEAFARLPSESDDLAPRLLTIIPLEKTLQGVPPESEASTALQPRRQRGQRQPRPELVLRDPPAVQVRSDVLTSLIMRGLLHGSEYQLRTSQGKKMAVYRMPLAKGRGELTITISPGQGQAWDDVLKSLEVLGDEVVDTFCALLALALDRYGTGRLHEPFYLSPDDILHVCQRRLSHGSFTPQQRAGVIEHLQVLTQAQVLATLPGSKPGQEFRAQSAIMDFLSGAIGEYRTATGETLWERREVKMGDWVQMVPPLADATAMMLRQILKYHPQRERFPKRLGRYITLQKPQREGYIVRKLRTLLTQAGIKPDPNHPGDTLTSFRNALVTLQEHKVISDFAPIIESITPEAHERILQRAYGWWDLCEMQEWRIDLILPEEDQTPRLAAPEQA